MISGKHYQSVWRCQNGRYQRPKSALPKTRMESSVSYDERIWLCLRQFHPCSFVGSSTVALYFGLQNSTQVHQWKEVSFPIIPWYLGKNLFFLLFSWGFLRWGWDGGRGVNSSSFVGSLIVALCFGLQNWVFFLK